MGELSDVLVFVVAVLLAVAAGTLPSLARPLWSHPWLVRAVGAVVVMVVVWAALVTDVLSTVWVFPGMLAVSTTSECLLWAHLAREHPYLVGRSYPSRFWRLFWRLNGAVGVAPGGRHGIPGIPAPG